MTLIIAGNALLILVVSSRKHFKTVTNVLVSSLAVADLIVGCFVIPTSIYGAIKSDKVSGFFFCSVIPFLQMLSLAASVFSLLVVTMERFRSIVQFAKPAITRRIGLQMVGAVWCIAIIYACKMFIQQFVNDSDSHGISNNQTAVEDDTAPPQFCNVFVEEEHFDLFFRVSDVVFLFAIPLVAMTVMYALMINRLWFDHTTTSTVETLRLKRRAIAMFVAAVVAFFVCWAPFYAMEIWHDAREMMTEDVPDADELEDMPTTRFLTIILALSNSWMTPVIYYIFNAQFRKELRSYVFHNSDDSRVHPSSGWHEMATQVSGWWSSCRQGDS